MCRSYTDRLISQEPRACVWQGAHGTARMSELPCVEASESVASLSESDAAGRHATSTAPAHPS